jgi:hypothetical protein
VILCDFFPLYDFPEDVCSPVRDQTDRKDRDSSNTQTILNSISNEKANNATKSVSYGFRRHNHPSIAEYLLVVWVFTLFCEEIRQVVCSQE